MTGVDEKDTRLISNLHWNQKAAARVGDDWVEIKRDVRLGSVLSPDLFSFN